MTASTPTLTEAQADALRDRLHAIRRADRAQPKFEAIRDMAEAIYVLAGWLPMSSMTNVDGRLDGAA